LRKEHELRAATHIVRMPGVQDCIAYLLSDCAALFSHMTSGKGVSFISVPREANNDWLEVRLWATERGGTRATELLQTKIEGFYEKARSLVTAEPVPPWDVCRWHAQLQAWRQESGAILVPFPPEWQETAVVKELWVFASFIGKGRYCQKKSTYAAKLVKETLEQAASAAGASSGAAASSATTQNEHWTQYQDKSGSKYWYREPDGFWFWETDKHWERFFDEASRCYWWWNKETGLWFYEPIKSE